ncbi:helix-turn-helix transcriptional regulator [Sulfurospirillum arcachonense]|uniref:helix-turn-helix transcriptional regulator n=1 Tax=Sulfurospirillum arcachonense TaxID=57666 RepID=UPI000467F1FB|nr:AraC family transcriptional regulator [Sulfurospirillum arcachonense]
MTSHSFGPKKIKKLFSVFGVSSTLYNFLIESLGPLGITQKEITAHMGETPLMVKGFEERVSIIKVLKLWQAIETLYPHSDIGMRIAELFTPEKAGIIGQLFMQTQTLSESVEMMRRYLSLIIGSITFDYVEEGEHSVFYFDAFPNLLVPKSVIECYVFICYFWSLKYLQTDELPVLRASFSYGKPLHVKRYKEVCPNTILNFNASRNYAVLEKSIFYKANKQFCSNIYKLIIEDANKLEFHKKSNTPFSSEVAKAIQEHIYLGNINLSTIALSLDISTTTLKRNLQKEGTTFKILFESVKKELSLLMLKNKNLNVEDIAFFLNYSEYSSFFRAFKKWHGVTPSYLRNQE